MRISPEFLFISQAASATLFELAQTVARELGPTLLISGNGFAAPAGDRLTVWTAPAYDNSSYRTRLQSWAKFLAHCLWRSTFISGRPVVFVNSNPPMGPWLTHLLKRTRGWPYLATVLDVYPDAVVGSGLMGEGQAGLRLWRWFNRRAYDQASAVVTLAPVMAERLSAQVRAGAVDILPSWVDTEAIVPLAKQDNPFARDHDLVSGLTVLYSGNLGATHDISGLVQAMQAMQNLTDHRFVFIGGGARRAELLRLGQRLANVTILPYQREDRVACAMAAGDVGIVTLGRGTAGISMPSKATYMMAAGCALLGLSYGDNDVARLIADHRCGINVQADDGLAVQAALQRFHNEPAFLAECRANSRRAAEEVFSSAVVVPRYVDILRRMRHEL